MAPLAVDPAALDSAGGAAVAAGAGLGAVISSLTAALAGCAGMAGDDPAGAVFGRSYDGSAAALVPSAPAAGVVAPPRRAIWVPHPCRRRRHRRLQPGRRPSR